MRNRNIHRLASLMFIILAGPSLLSSQASPIRVVDYEKREVALPSDAKRIVSLVPSALRILVQIGAGERVVGIDRKSFAARATMLPFLASPRLATLPVVGDRKEPNLEAILGLSPDLVITTSTADKANALQSALGIPVLCIISEPDEDYEVIRMVAAVCGARERADRLIGYLSGKARELEARTSSIQASAKKTVYLGLFTNAGTFTQTMPVYQSLKLAGGINVAADLRATTSWGSVEINKERILAWDPDFVFVDWRETKSYLSRDAFMADPEFGCLAASKSGKVHYSQTSHDGKDYASALAEAYYMASILYPQVVTQMEATATAEEVFKTVYGLQGYYRSWIERFGIQ